MKFAMGVLSAVVTGGTAAMAAIGAHASASTIFLSFIITTAKAAVDVWAEPPVAAQDRQ